MRETPRYPSPRRWLIVGGAVLGVAAIAVVSGVLYAGDHDDSATNAGSAPSTTPAPTASETAAAPVDIDPNAPVTGCIVGPVRDAQSLALAQKTAPHTPQGAAEVAVQSQKYLRQWPLPSEAEIEQVSRSMFVEGSVEAGDVAEAIRKSNPASMTDGVISGSTAFHVTAQSGAYTLDGRDADHVSVNLGLYPVVNGTPKTDSPLTMRVDLQWDRGAWRVAGAGSGADNVFSTGQVFTEGC